MKTLLDRDREILTPPHVVYLRLTPAEYATLERAAAHRSAKVGLTMTAGQLARVLVVRGALKECRKGVRHG